uniref:Uncharacterized protein n=1 Tax=Heligmosomoides polygyrus TaxID=6339 RepID=A0A183G8X2_HELPZ
LTHQRPSTSWAPSEDFTVDEPSRKINALSLSLQESKAALAQANARVSALLERNEELSKSDFPSSTSSAGRSGRGSVYVRTLFVCLIVALYLPGVTPTQCGFAPRTELVPDVSTPLRALTIQLYRPNTSGTTHRHPYAKLSNRRFSIPSTALALVLNPKRSLIKPFPLSIVG